MAGLADDWGQNRQTCVEVLCGYLRMPYEPDPGDEASELERLAFGPATKSAVPSSGSLIATASCSPPCPGTAPARSAGSRPTPASTLADYQRKRPLAWGA